MIYRLGTLLCLILSLLFLSACSDSDPIVTAESVSIESTASEAIATETQVSEIESPDSSAENSLPELSETYRGGNVLIGSTLTVNYPLGWTIRGSDTQLLLSSEDPEEIDSNNDAILINILPVADDMLFDAEIATAESVVEDAIEEVSGQAVDVTTRTINGQAAAYAMADLNGNSGFVYAIQFDDGVFVVLTAIKAQAFTANEERLIAAIAESILYEAGGIPQNNE